MPRVRKGAARHQKHKSAFSRPPGAIAGRHPGSIGWPSRRPIAAVFATRDRKTRKRDFRRLWITRISAACQQRGLLYSRFIHALGEAKIALNRKMLSEIAIADPAAFDAIVTAAKAG